MAKKKGRNVEAIDAGTRADLDEGIRLANEDPRRWTPEQVRSDANKFSELTNARTFVGNLKAECMKEQEFRDLYMSLIEHESD